MTTVGVLIAAVQVGAAVKVMTDGPKPKSETFDLVQPTLELTPFTLEVWPVPVEAKVRSGKPGNRPSRIKRSQQKVAQIESGGTLAKIARCESGGSYTAQNPRSSASGKYQVLDSTWNGYGGYKRAKDAPPAVQEAQARKLWDNGKGASHWRACL